MSIPKYQVYKESSVSWLGPVPSHWEVLRLKYACEVFPSNVDKHSRDDEPPVLLCNYTDVYYNERITAALPFMAATASAEQIARFTLKGGDTIITKDSETADDIAIAAYVPEDLPGVVCGYHLSMVRPRSSTCGAYVKRLFDSFYAKARFAVAANGLTRVGLGQYALDNVELPFPPPDEQRAIVTFLDSETSKIDGLVEEQRRLIELLKEKRHAVIAHVVTKGLNPNVPMKDSGIEWIGEVPAHWSITRLGYFATVENGTTPSRDAPAYWADGDVPWLSSGEVNKLYVDASDEFITQAALQECSLRLLPAGTVIVGLIGQGKTRGMSALLQIDATINQNLAAICPGPKAVGKYFLYLFHAMYEWLREAGRGGNQAAMNCEMLRSLKIPVPSVAEQTAIASSIDSRLAELDALRTEAELTMSLLGERRSALISAAVTGKIDVRGLVPQPEAVAA